MRKHLAVTLLLILAIAGCHKNVVVAPVPGSINPFDAYAFRSLADAQASLNSVKNDISAGKWHPTSGETSYINKAISDYDAAEALYQTYHAAAGNDPAALQSAITQLVTDITQLTTIASGGAH